MIRTVKFPRITQFTGRSGYFKCSGLELMALEHNKSIMLSPLTGKGDIGRCDIEVPLEALDELIETLKEIRNANTPT